MAVQGTFYRTETQRLGVTPVSPPQAVDDPVGPVNPPGSTLSHDPVTLGSPANGLSLVGQQLSIGLASSGVTGVLSGTDWNTFNGKIGGSLTSGRIPFATGVNTLGDDSGFTWNNVSKRLELGGASIRPFYISRTGGSSIIRLNRNDENISSAVGGIEFTNFSNQVISGIASFTEGGNDLGSILFYTSSNNNQTSIYSLSERWRISNNGNFVATGGNTIGSTSNGNINIVPNGTGLVGIKTSFPTNTLDVNGTTRIRTINNLGTAATVLLTKSATGVISERTLAELASDGLGSKWTDGSGFIYRDGPVVVGRTTLPTNATFAVQSKSAVSIIKFIQILNSSGVETISYTEGGQFNFSGSSIQMSHGSDLEWPQTGTALSSLFRFNSSLDAAFNLYQNNNIYLRSANSSIYINRDLRFYSGSINDASPSGTLGVQIRAFAIQPDTTTGLKIANANTQKLAFWNATPIVQPLEAALANTPNTGDTDTDNLITALKNIILNTGLGRAS